MLKVEYTKRFLKELAKLPSDVRDKAEMIVFQQLLTENPLGLGSLEKMKGYPGKYKIRIGDYRIGLSIDKEENLIICQRIANRKDIYKTFP